MLHALSHHSLVPHVSSLSRLCHTCLLLSDILVEEKPAGKKEEVARPTNMPKTREYTKLYSNPQYFIDQWILVETEKSGGWAALSERVNYAY